MYIDANPIYLDTQRNSRKKHNENKDFEKQSRLSYDFFYFHDSMFVYIICTLRKIYKECSQ